jgi:hypothetical protein
LNSEQIKNSLIKPNTGLRRFWAHGNDGGNLNSYAKEHHTQMMSSPSFTLYEWLHVTFNKFKDFSMIFFARISARDFTSCVSDFLGGTQLV